MPSEASMKQAHNLWHKMEGLEKDICIRLIAEALDKAFEEALGGATALDKFMDAANKLRGEIP